MAVSDEETLMHFENQDQFSAWYRRAPAGDKYAKASEQASETDRKWFAANPGVNVYVRPMVKHEFPPLPNQPPIISVCVVQVHPKLRLRHPMFKKGQSS